jgi:hypothetical protein
MNAAETYGDPDLQILLHYSTVSAYFHLGDPLKAREHADRVLALYSEERLGSLNVGPKSGSLVYSALSTWMLGYPEQAVRRSARREPLTPGGVGVPFIWPGC